MDLPTLVPDYFEKFTISSTVQCHLCMRRVGIAFKGGFTLNGLFIEQTDVFCERCWDFAGQGDCIMLELPGAKHEPSLAGYICKYCLCELSAQWYTGAVIYSHKEDIVCDRCIEIHGNKYTKITAV